MVKLTLFKNVTTPKPPIDASFSKRNKRRWAVKILLTLLALWLIAVGLIFSNAFSADSEVAAFYNEARLRGVMLRPNNTDVHFTVLFMTEWDAYCDLFTNQVYVDARAWERSDPAEREIIIFHELGHCVLGLEHEEDGIMAPAGPSLGTYYTDRTKWVDALFRGGN